jgi:hypothetical protein
MSNWYELRIDRALREAAERGEFDNLPGSGKPLPNRGELYDEEWWIKDLVRRESLVGDGLASGLPPALALRKEIENLPSVVAHKHTEAAVRGVVAELNDRIMLARRGPVDGPPVTVNPVDADAVVRAWQAARAAAAPTAVPTKPAEPARTAGSRRRRWWRRQRTD